ncbi:unnamed protein product [Meganyctiphanes norvegica]|uniref:Uncharacterized protein n=1 Tax=Meganyctiphanes norvegica TaxID=48144 RepID=A0AAV2PTQ8_MEGNR
MVLDFEGSGDMVLDFEGSGDMVLVFEGSRQSADLLLYLWDVALSTVSNVCLELFDLFESIEDFLISDGCPIPESDVFDLVSETDKYIGSGDKLLDFGQENEGEGEILHGKPYEL